MIETVAAAIAAFFSTNIDDLFVLTALFGMKSLSRWQVVAGQYLGFAVLTGLGLAGSLGVLVVPRPLIGLLGLFPVYLGVRGFFAGKRGRGQTEEEPQETALTGAAPSIWPESKAQALSGMKVLQVALITVGNGGDNIATYIPLFAQASPLAGIATAGVFFALIGIWCYAGYRLRHNSRVAGALERYGHRIVPTVLIGLGVYILLKSGTVAFLLAFAR